MLEKRPLSSELASTSAPPWPEKSEGLPASSSQTPLDPAKEAQPRLPTSILTARSLPPSLFGKQRPAPGTQRHARHPTPSQRQSPLHPSLKVATTGQLRTRERERSHGGPLPTCVCALGQTFLGLPWSETALHSTKRSVLQPRVEDCSCGQYKAWAAGSLQPHAVGSPAAPTGLNNRAPNRVGRTLVSALLLRRYFLRPLDHRHHATTPLNLLLP